MKLRDAVVVVTGASSGIGRATALAFARRGATLVVTARRAGPLEELSRECELLGGRALAVPGDVRDPRVLTEVARAAVDSFGRIDVWVNNAGVSMLARLEDTPLQLFREVLDTNLMGYVHGARAALPVFREQGRGVLVQVSSMVGKIGQAFTTAYAASKFAILGLTESLRAELLDVPGIHVCAVLPSSTDTPLFQHAANLTGRGLKPIPPVSSADRVAEAIVRCARRPRREVVLRGRAGLALRAVAPGPFERAFARKVDRDHFQDRSAPPTSGNVLAPVPFGTRTDGGWLSPARRPSLPRAALGAVLGAVLAWTVARSARLLGA